MTVRYINQCQVFMILFQMGMPQGGMAMQPGLMPQGMNMAGGMSPMTPAASTAWGMQAAQVSHTLFCF